MLGWGAYPNTIKAQSWSFAVLGDQRDQGETGINQPIVAAMAAQIASQIVSKNIAFVLCAGDQIHGINSEGGIALKDQYTNWKTAMAPILDISYPVRGNHETYGDVNTPGPDYAKAWMDNIANVLPQIPKNGPPNEVGMSYSFRNQNVFIVGLEQSYAGSWYQVNQPWLNDQLKANTLPFTFTYGHYPAFSLGPNIEEGSLAEHPAARNAFWKSLGDSSVNIYLSGHIHLYNRARISIDGGPEIQQFVIGGGGGPLVRWNPPTYPDIRVKGEYHQEDHFGYTLVTVDGNKITADYYSYDQTANTWTVLDSYTYTITARKFGANDASQSIDPATLTDYYAGIGLTKIGLGNLTLNSGTSTYSNTITVSAGGLDVQGDYSSALVTVQSGAQVILGAGGKVAGVTVDSGGTLLIGNTAGLGLLGLTINGGTVGSSAVSIHPTNAITVGGSFNLGTTAGNDLTLVQNLVMGANNITHTGAGADTLTGIVSGTGAITVNAGTLTLSGANIYTGNSMLTAGNLLAGNNAAFGPLGTLNINGGTIGASAANITVANALAIGGNFNMGGAAGTNLELTQGMNLTGFLLTHNGASNDTLSGALTNGAGGGITVTAGTLNLSGNSSATYPGTTTVNDGTLNLTGATGTLGGLVNINSGGTFNLNSTFGAGTLPAGAVTVLGTGIFNMGAGSSYNAGAAVFTVPATGTFTLAATSNLTVGVGGFSNLGTTTVNGTLTGNLTNNAGSLVNGSGTITGTLTNNGTLRPGNSPGITTVGVHAPGTGTLALEVASGAGRGIGYSALTVTGNSTLTGTTLQPFLTGGFIPTTNQVFTGIVTTGGVQTGQFASIANNARVGDSRTLFWQALYNPASVDLKAVGNYTPSDLSLSANQRSVGNALNGVAPSASGDLLTVLDAINALTTDAGVQAAFNEISPAKYAALPTMTMPITHLQFQNLQNRLARERWEAELGSDVVSSGGGGFMKGFSFGYEEKMILAASNMTVSDAGTPLIRKGVEQRWGVYLEPTANWGTLSPTANMVGYRYKNFGFTLGAEYWVMDNLLVGVNTGYSKTLAGVGGTGGDINANVIPFNAYSAFFMKGFYANATLGYTYSGYDIERNIAFGTINRTAKASTSGNQFQLGAETGYDAKIGNAVVGPVLSLQYATQTTGGFTESNAGALSLKVGSQSADSVQSGLGARASYKAKVGNVTVKPQLAVVWQHEFSNNTRGVNARLAQGSSTMNIRTDKIGQNFAVVSFDLPARISKNFVANIGYTAEVGRDKSSNMGVNIGLKLKW